MIDKTGFLRSPEFERATALRGLTSLREEADQSATVDSHIQFGEEILINRKVGEWFDCSVDFFGYVRDGYIHASELGIALGKPTHRIERRWAPLFAYPGSRARVLDQLPRGSHIQVIGENKSYYLIWPRGVVFKNHVASIDSPYSDYVDNMLSLSGTPFMWGGRTALGVDCAGFIELALRLAGLPCPRHREEMPDFFGPPLSNETPIAGDLAMFSNHCIAFSAEDHVMHSSAVMGEVIEEPLRDFLQRREETGDTTFIHLRPHRGRASAGAASFQSGTSVASSLL